VHWTKKALIINRVGQMGGFFKTHPPTGFFGWILVGFNGQFPTGKNKLRHAKNHQIYFTLSLIYNFLVIGVNILV
jgi:hypothetical protein